MHRKHSLLREFRVSASAAGHAVRVFGEEHAGSALRAVRSLPRNAIPVDLVEPSLEARRSLFLLRFGHHLPAFFFGSAFFSSFFSSFFSAGFFSSFCGAFFSSLGPGFGASFAAILSAFGSGFPSDFGASGFGAGGFSALGVGAGFSGFGAASFLTSGSITLLRTRMCLRSTIRACSFV